MILMFRAFSNMPIYSEMLMDCQAESWTLGIMYSGNHNLVSWYSRASEGDYSGATRWNGRMASGPW